MTADGGILVCGPDGTLSRFSLHAAAWNLPAVCALSSTVSPGLLPSGDVFVTGAAANGSLCLRILAAADGKLLRQASPVAGGPGRASAVYANGTLLVPTAAGALLAVDDGVRMAEAWQYDGAGLVEGQVAARLIAVRILPMPLFSPLLRS